MGKPTFLIEIDDRFFLVNSVAFAPNGIHSPAVSLTAIYRAQSIVENTDGVLRWFKTRIHPVNSELTNSEKEQYILNILKSEHYE